MQVIYTSNGGGKTDRANGREWRGGSPKVSPSRTSSLPRGWREKVRRWCHPSPGARPLWKQELGPWREYRLMQRAREEMLWHPYSLHPPTPQLILGQCLQLSPTQQEAARVSREGCGVVRLEYPCNWHLMRVKISMCPQGCADGKIRPIRSH